MSDSLPRDIPRRRATDVPSIESLRIITSSMEATMLELHHVEIVGTRVSRMILAQTTTITGMLVLFAFRDALSLSPPVFERAIVIVAAINILSALMIFVLDWSPALRSRR